MSDHRTDGSLRARANRLFSSLKDEDYGGRRKIAVLAVFLLILLIPAFLYGPGLLDRTRNYPDRTTTTHKESVDTQADTDPAQPDEPPIDPDIRVPASLDSVCGDGVCDSRESCPRDCLVTKEPGAERTPATEEPPSLAVDPCPLADCPDPEESGPNEVIYCGLFCRTDTDCGDVSAASGVQLSCTNYHCWDAATCNDLGDVDFSAGICGSPCVTDANCDGLACLQGTCWNVAACNPAAAQPDSPDTQGVAASDLCQDHGGLQWKGNVCVCAGVIDRVTICLDGFKIDEVTDMVCVSDQHSCGSDSDIVQEELMWVPGAEGTPECTDGPPDETKC